MRCPPVRRPAPRRRPAAPLLRALPIVVLAALAAGVLALAGAAAARGPVLELEGPPARVVDGDTFEADLDGDGRLEFPRERVRLLYVDTPELWESDKGRDRAHGLPARDFLREALGEGPLRLRLPAGERTGNYGRTLAVVETSAGEGWRNVNLALVRAGHSPLDTRFALPPHEDYEAYVAAEAEAFAARRGIWREAASRERYLERLREAGRTPAAPGNPLYAPGVLDAATFEPARYEDRYVTLAGRLAGRRTLSKGVLLLFLQRAEGRPFGAVVFPDRADRLGARDWPPGARVRLEGFIRPYEGRLELGVHYGTLR